MFWVNRERNKSYRLSRFEWTLGRIKTKVNTRPIRVRIRVKCMGNGYSNARPADVLIGIQTFFVIARSLKQREKKRYFPVIRRFLFTKHLLCLCTRADHSDYMRSLSSGSQMNAKAHPQTLE